MTPGGEFVAVWDDDCRIRARRYDASGQPLDETEFQVNDYTPACGFAPSVATGATGNFVVVWSSEVSEGSVGDRGIVSIQARRIFSDGTPEGPQFQVNTYTTGSQLFPAVATDAVGNFVIAWTSRQGGYPYSYISDFHARRFSADGTPIGEDFRVNTLDGSSHDTPFAGLAVAVDGEFAVVWDGTSAGTDRDNSSIQARRYSSDGVPVGEQFQVNTYTTGPQIWPQTVIDSQGRLLVAWQNDWPGPIRARRIRFPTSPSDAVEFQVNADSSHGSWPSVALDPDGGFVVVWRGFDGNQGAILGRQFRPDATPVGDDFQVNTYSSSQLSPPTVATDRAGNFVVSWTSTVNGPGDSDARARRYDALFRDGFESGDIGRWSDSIP